jgi:hypothetical protein
MDHIPGIGRILQMPGRASVARVLAARSSALAGHGRR